jgi:hypothetical protein
METSFFPQGFWASLAAIGMVVFLVFGVDLLFGARLMSSVSRTLNRQFHVDEILMRALQELKRTSDREFDVETSILRGWGRFVMSGLLLFGAVLLLMNVIPALR